MLLAEKGKRNREEAQIHLFPIIGFMFNKFVVRIMKHKGSLNTLTLIMERKMSLLFTSQMMTLLMKLQHLGTMY